MFMSCSSTSSTVNNPEPHLLEHHGRDVLQDQQQSISIHERYKYVYCNMLLIEALKSRLLIGRANLIRPMALALRFGANPYIRRRFSLIGP